jgi:excisionase family DNA binding protein
MLLTIQDLQKLFKISRRTVYHWIKKKILHPIRIGGIIRFRKEDIDALLQGIPQTQPHMPKILVVDDDILVRLSLAQLLQRHGFEIVAVSSGKEALAAVEGQTFDLVISDYRMPEMNGAETLGAIQKVMQARKKNMRAIFLTAYADDAVRAQARQIGVRTVVEKPFDVEDFVQVLQTSLN